MELNLGGSFPVSRHLTAFITGTLGLPNAWWHHACYEIIALEKLGEARCYSVTRDAPSGTFACAHAGWRALPPRKPLVSDSQTGGKLSPQAIFERGVMEKERRRQWTTPAEQVLRIPH